MDIGIVATYPGKFVGFGTIGFGNPQRAIAEIDRCITQLGFKGLQIFSNIAGKVLDSAEHRPVFQHIGRIGVPVHLHPAIPLGQMGLDNPSLALSVGFPYDASLNTLRLIYSGAFDENPALKLIVAHTLLLPSAGCGASAIRDRPSVWRLPSASGTC